jgi:hypothetical protein
LIGKWCAQYGDDRTMIALMDAQRQSLVEPIAWINAKLAAAVTREDAWDQNLGVFGS